MPTLALIYCCHGRLTASDYDRWIRHLVCVLMAFSATRKLRHADVIASGVLLPLCRKDTEFCEKLLPYVFYELVKNDSTNLIGPELSSAINGFYQHALESTSEVHGVACKTMTRALDTLRTFAFFETNATASSDKGAKTYAKSDKGARSATNAATGRRVRRKPLSVDYLLVAKCVQSMEHHCLRSGN
eukprot:m.1163015 g.1163015  ORF g.1163015 m.1163015 type:complete len:187 (+) comp24502_c0_seq26:175-735(+)